MKFSEWLKPDTVAILCTAIYYGVPNQDHTHCYKEMIAEVHPRLEQISNGESLQGKLCIACSKPLVKRQP